MQRMKTYAVIGTGDICFGEDKQEAAADGRIRHRIIGLTPDGLAEVKHMIDAKKYAIGAKETDAAFMERIRSYS